MLRLCISVRDELTRVSYQQGAFLITGRVKPRHLSQPQRAAIPRISFAPYRNRFVLGLESELIFGGSNIEFSCRPESYRYAPVPRNAFLLSTPRSGGQLQRFVR